MSSLLTKSPWISLLILGISASSLLATESAPAAQKDAAAPQFTLAKAKPLTSAKGPIKTSMYAGLLFADINGDGKTDLLATEVFGSMTFHAGSEGAQPFAAGAQLKLADGTAASITNW